MNETFAQLNTNSKSSACISKLLCYGHTIEDTWKVLNFFRFDKLINSFEMVVKAVCVINGDAKGTVFFEQEVRIQNHLNFSARQNVRKTEVLKVK